MKITLSGIPPSKKNSKRIITRGSRQYIVPSENYDDWHVDATWEIKSQRVIPVLPIEKAAVKITFFAPTMRPADLTNKAESIMDLLVDLGILKDDNWFICGDLHLKFGGVEKKDPRAIIEITRL